MSKENLKAFFFIKFTSLFFSLLQQYLISHIIVLSFNPLVFNIFADTRKLIQKLENFKHIIFFILDMTHNIINDHDKK